MLLSDLPLPVLPAWQPIHCLPELLRRILLVQEFVNCLMDTLPDRARFEKACRLNHFSGIEPIKYHAAAQTMFHGMQRVLPEIIQSCSELRCNNSDFDTSEISLANQSS